MYLYLHKHACGCIQFCIAKCLKILFYNKLLYLVSEPALVCTNYKTIFGPAMFLSVTNNAEARKWSLYFFSVLMAVNLYHVYAICSASANLHSRSLYKYIYWVCHLLGQIIQVNLSCSSSMQWACAREELICFIERRCWFVTKSCDCCRVVIVVFIH